jgi:hypothetical protein
VLLKVHVNKITGKISINSESESEWSSVNTLVRFAQAEGLDLVQLKSFLKLTVRAFRYGIALMIPYLPFVITQTIRTLLNNRQIPVIFSTHEMAVGINYGLRNVAIVQCDTKADYPVTVFACRWRDVLVEGVSIRRLTSCTSIWNQDQKMSSNRNRSLCLCHQRLHPPVHCPTYRTSHQTNLFQSVPTAFWTS